MHLLLPRYIAYALYIHDVNNNILFARSHRFLQSKEMRGKPRRHTRACYIKVRNWQAEHVEIKPSSRCFLRLMIRDRRDANLFIPREGLFAKIYPGLRRFVYRQAVTVYLFSQGARFAYNRHDVVPSSPAWQLYRSRLTTRRIDPS